MTVILTIVTQLSRPPDKGHLPIRCNRVTAGVKGHHTFWIQDMKIETQGRQPARKYPERDCYVVMWDVLAVNRSEKGDETRLARGRWWWIQSGVKPDTFVLNPLPFDPDPSTAAIHYRYPPRQSNIFFWVYRPGGRAKRATSPTQSSRINALSSLGEAYPQTIFGLEPVR